MLGPMLSATRSNISTTTGIPRRKKGNDIEAQLAVIKRGIEVGEQAFVADPAPVPTTATTTMVSRRGRDAEEQFADDDTNDFNPQSGKSMGIAMVATTTCTLICGFIPYIGSIVVLISSIATIALSSALTCGCCCAKDYQLRSKAKKWATAILSCVSLVFILTIIFTIIVMSVASTEVASTGTISMSTVQGAAGGALAVAFIVWILNVLAVVFACLFTWGQDGCCK